MNHFKKFSYLPKISLLEIILSASILRLTNSGLLRPLVKDGSCIFSLLVEHEIISSVNSVCHMYIFGWILVFAAIDFWCRIIDVGQKCDMYERSLS